MLKSHPSPTVILRVGLHPLGGHLGVYLHLSVIEEGSWPWWEKRMLVILWFIQKNSFHLSMSYRAANARCSCRWEPIYKGLTVGYIYIFFWRGWCPECLRDLPACKLRKTCALFYLEFYQKLFPILKMFIKVIHASVVFDPLEQPPEPACSLQLSWWFFIYVQILTFFCLQKYQIGKQISIFNYLSLLQNWKSRLSGDHRLVCLRMYFDIHHFNHLFILLYFSFIIKVEKGILALSLCYIVIILTIFQTLHQLNDYNSLKAQMMVIIF